MQQAFGCAAVCGLPAGKQERQRAFLAVGQGVDFSGASAATDAEDLTFKVPFPPAAHRCALT